MIGEHDESSVFRECQVEDRRKRVTSNEFQLRKSLPTKNKLLWSNVELAPGKQSKTRGNIYFTRIN